jgi:hypothetical protein
MPPPLVLGEPGVLVVLLDPVELDLSGELPVPLVELLDPGLLVDAPKPL